MSAAHSREVLAEFEHRLRLVRFVDAGGARRFEIEELRPNGPVTVGSYEHGDFPRAAVEYGWRFAETFDSAAEEAHDHG